MVSRYLAVGGSENILGLINVNDNEIHFYKLPEMNQIKIIADRAPIRSFEISRDGKLLVEANHEDNNIYLWDIYRQKKINTLTGHTGRINDLSFSTNGKLLASASNDGNIIIWNIHENSKTTLKGHQGFVRKVRFASQDSLISGGFDRIINIWRLSESEPVMQIATSGPVTALDVHQNKIVWGTIQGGIAIYDLNKEDLKEIDQAHNGLISNIHILKKENFLISSGWDHKAKVWNLDLQPSQILNDHKDYILSSLVVESHGFLLTSGRDEKINLYKIHK